MPKQLDLFIDDYLNSPRGQEATAIVGSHVVNVYRAQLVEDYGERCPDFEPECCVCQAWKQFDNFRR